MTAPLFIEKRLRPSIKVVNTETRRYYYLRCPNIGTLIRLPVNTRGDAERTALKYLLADAPTIQPRAEPTKLEAAITRQTIAMKPALESVLSSAARRARKRGLPCPCEPHHMRQALFGWRIG